LSIVLRSSMLPHEKEETIKRRLIEEIGVEHVEVTRNLSIVMIVGAAMARTVGVTARAATALARAGVNLEVINQGASEISVMFGVREEFCDFAIRELYKEFFPR
ncbi:MAG: ACT domain-containing protein, partial [Clostridiaceae bacterium]|nr:ACT domain-containing protein [Clostridiaceae bacterium]